MDRRNVLVVGGSGGVGSFIVKAFHEAGYNVYFTYNSNEEGAKKLAVEYHVESFQVNSLNESEVNDCREWIGEKLCGGVNFMRWFMRQGYVKTI